VNQQGISYEKSMKTRYLNMKAFLELFGLTPVEAQVIIEICNYNEYYVDVRTLLKKMPKTFSKFAYDLDETLKNLIQKGYLNPYESKKDDFCVRSAPFGRDFVRTAIQNGFESFEDLPSLEAKYSKTELMCFDPQRFKKGEVRYPSGPNGSKIQIQIIDIGPSNEVFSTTVDGRTIYGIRLIASAECPRCSNKIPVDFSYTTETCYVNYNPIICDKCKFKFMLGCSLNSYYT